jgi:hypothetical protein
MSAEPVRALRSRLGRRVVRRMGWLVGAPLATFRFLRRAMPVVEVEMHREPPALPAEEPDDEHREKDLAVGPTVHRIYGARIRRPVLTAERLMAIIAADPNVFAPTEVLRFEKHDGAAKGLKEGDELLIRLAGPWNAPVKVTRRWDQGFRLATVRGHPQLGQLEIRARDEPDGIAVEIQTRERAAGWSFDALQRIGLIRRMQSYTWVAMLENAARLAGGSPPDRVTVQTWRSRGDP